MPEESSSSRPDSIEATDAAAPHAASTPEAHTHEQTGTPADPMDLDYPTRDAIRPPLDYRGMACGIAVVAGVGYLGALRIDDWRFLFVLFFVPLYVGMFTLMVPVHGWKQHDRRKRRRLLSDSAERIIWYTFFFGFPIYYILITSAFRIWSLIGPDQLLGVASAVIATWIFQTALYLLLTGYFREVGRSLHCGWCGYDLGLEPPSPCPECGCPWSSARPLRVSRRERCPHRIWGGAAVGALSMVLLVTMMGPLEPLTSRAPTAMLLARIERDPQWATEELWKDLTSRQLSPPERERLADTMLERLEMDDFRLYLYMQDPLVAWLLNEVTNARLNDEQTGRLAETLADASLSTKISTRRRSRRAGWDVDLRHRVSVGYNASAIRSVHTLSLRINGESIDVERARLSTHTPEVHRIVTLDPSDLPPTDSLSIEVDAIMLLLPRPGPQLSLHHPIYHPIEIDEEGDPILPDDTLLYRRVALTETVDHPAR